MINKKYNYEFTEEDWNKLSQLDRIEYRQREEIIRRHYDFSFVTVIIWSFNLLFGFMVLVAITGYGSLGLHFAILMITLILVLIRIFIVLFILAFIGDAVMASYKRMAMKKLKDSYFKVEVKKR